MISYDEKGARRMLIELSLNYSFADGNGRFIQSSNEKIVKL